MRAVGDEAHPATAAAGRRLDHQRIPDLRRGARERVVALILRMVAGQKGDAGMREQPFRTRLVAERAHRCGRRTDEREPRVRAALREFGAFREESVAGMHRIRTGHRGGVQHRIDVQVRFARRRAAQALGVGGRAHVRRVLVGIRIDGDRFERHLRGRAHDAQRDLAAVCDQETLHGRATPN